MLIYSNKTVNLKYNFYMSIIGENCEHYSIVYWQAIASHHYYFNYACVIISSVLIMGKAQ